MSDPSTWTAGYVADIGYTFGYYPELNPSRVPLAFLNAGLSFPKIHHACELGFGQGLSINIHSAASTTNWFGTDFNPSQASFAKELQSSCESNAQLFDQAFNEFCTRDDLPEFDFVGLHGIWSWISDENRATLVDFLRRKLQVGGVLYISYNTYPGWAAFAPLRHLMVDHAETLGTEGRGIVSRIDGAIEFADRVLKTDPLFLRANPLVAERLKRLKEHNRHYLAHEYFNRDWHPMHFSTMANWLQGAKLQFACSANFLDTLDAINLTKEQQELLAEIPDPLFKQAVRDFMVNQQFRKDYWVKGARPVTALNRTEHLRSLRFLLAVPRSSASLKVTGALGEATLADAVYGPILDALSDNLPHSIIELERNLTSKKITLAQLVEALSILVTAGNVFPVLEDEGLEARRQRTDKLNTYIMTHSKSSGDFSYLASPHTGGGHPVDRFSQVFALAHRNGNATPESWAKFAWAALQEQGQRIVKAGTTLETDEENLSELLTQAETFHNGQFKVLKALSIL